MCGVSTCAQNQPVESGARVDGVEVMIQRSATKLDLCTDQREGGRLALHPELRFEVPEEMPEVHVEIISVSGHHYVIVVPVAHAEHARRDAVAGE